MNKEKRMAGDYEITAAMHIGDKEIVLGENLTDTDTPYMVGFCESNELMARYYGILRGNDYAEVVQLYGERIVSQAQQVCESVKALNIPVSVIAKEDCIPDSYDRSIKGRVIAIDPDVLRGEYRRADRQLYFVTGGFGAEANSRGDAVFCTNLHTGEHARYERSDVMGEVKPDRLPDWAKEALGKLPEQEKPKKHKDRER